MNSGARHIAIPTGSGTFAGVRRIAPMLLGKRDAVWPVYLGILLLAFRADVLVPAADAATADTAAPTAASGQEEALLFASPTTRDHIGRIVVPVTINGKGPFRFI